MSSTTEFACGPDASSIMSVTALVIKQLENAAKDVSRQHIHLLADKYSFDAEEAIEWLDIVAPLSLEEKKMARKAKADDASSTDSKKKTIPLPWMGMVSADCCQAIAYNYGLFTQCQKKKVSTFYCAACEKASKETSTGNPPCGTVAERLAQPIWADYKDSKNRQPIPYAKVLYKLKFTLEEAIASAEAKGIVIPEQHLGIYEPPVGKSKTVKTVDASGNVFDAVVAGSVDGSTSSKGRKLSPEEKLAREEKRKAEKEQKAAEAATKKKHENDAKALAAIGRSLIQLVDEGIPISIAQAAIDKHNETLAKKAELTAKREAEKAIKKAEKDAEKEAKKAEKEAEKEAKKAEKEAAKKGTVKPIASAPAPAPQPVAVAPAPQSVKVQRINLAGEVGKKGQEGFIYLRDHENKVYNAETKEEVGMWNGTQIVFIEAEEEEETI